MSTIGIIAEYNPLHNGHEYQIQKALRELNAKHVVVLITGNYTLRGMPAIISKHHRAKMAIAAGADLAIEIPPCYVLEDTQRFAHCAISMLNSLGIVDQVLFSSELGKLNNLMEMSEILTSDAFKSIYQSFPELSNAERRRATMERLGYPDYAQCVNRPNNLFGIYFINSLREIASTIKPLTIKRIGSNYFDNMPEIGSNDRLFTSATAIRELLEKTYPLPYSIPTEVTNCVPPYVYYELKKNWKRNYPLFIEDFWPAIQKRIKSITVEAMASISGIDVAMATLMKKQLKYADSCQAYIASLSSKYTNLNFYRRLFRVLTDQKCSDIDNYLANGTTLCIDILSRSDQSDELVKTIFSRNTNASCICDGKKIIGINPLAEVQYQNTRRADRLYEEIAVKKYKTT